MNIKLTNQEVSILELLILDCNSSKNSKSIKTKILYTEQINERFIIDLSDDEYLFLLDSIEDKMSDELFSVYHNLVMQDKLDIIKIYEIETSII